MSDTQAFEAMMSAYQDMVYGTAVRLLGSEADAEDISQEVFLRAYERFDDLQGSPTVGGWLKTVTRHLCLNHLQRYRSRWRLFSEVASANDEEAALETFDAATEIVGSSPGTGDDWVLIETALGKLPDEQRVPLVLFHLEGLAYEDIAHQLGVSLSKVKTDIYRGRLALRRLLQSRRSDLGLTPGDEATARGVTRANCPTS